MRPEKILLMLLVLSACSKNETPPPTPLDPAVGSQAVSIFEGNGGTTAMEFTFTLSAASSKPASVRVVSNNGFAIAGEDYKKVDQVLQFALNSQSHIFKVVDSNQFSSGFE